MLVNPVRLDPEVRRELSRLNSTAPAVTVTLCTSTTRPTNPETGRMVFETNTKNLRVWDGSSWVAVVGVWG